MSWGIFTRTDDKQPWRQIATKETKVEALRVLTQLICKHCGRSEPCDDVRFAPECGPWVPAAEPHPAVYTIKDLAIGGLA